VQEGEPASLNPIFNNRADASTQLLYEPLLRLGPGLHFVPALATAEPTTRNGGISRDGKTITFHLRPGTLWSDGSLVTSADVQFGIEAILNPRNDVVSRSGFDRITAIRTPDANTIVFVLKRPSATALAALEIAAVPLPKHLLRGHSDLNSIAYNAKPVGNGPYRFVAWKRGDRIELETNTRYWRGAPKIAHLDVLIVPSVKTALLRLQAREVDLTRISSAFADQIPRSGVKRVVAPTLFWNQLTFNLASPILADRRVRQAIALAVDRANLARDAGHGLLSADRPLLPLFGWALDPHATFPAFDARAATELLDRAGWRVDRDGVRRKDGRTLTLSLLSVAGANPITAAVLAEQLEAVGFHVDQKTLPPQVLFGPARAGGVLQSGRFDLALIGMSGDPEPDASWLLACDQRPPEGSNFSRYCNPLVDADLAQAESTNDRAIQERAYWDVQRHVVADVPFLPLHRIDYVYAVADRLRGFRPSEYSAFWNAYEWSAPSTANQREPNAADEAADRPRS
jgi:peptide/nickel transport system substrate-binding protein